jgi:hypothetical protein
MEWKDIFDLFRIGLQAQYGRAGTRFNRTHIASYDKINTISSRKHNISLPLHIHSDCVLRFRCSSSAKAMANLPLQAYSKLGR